MEIQDCIAYTLSLSLCLSLSHTHELTDIQDCIAWDYIAYLDLDQERGCWLRASHTSKSCVNSRQIRSTTRPPTQRTISSSWGSENLSQSTPTHRRPVYHRQLSASMTPTVMASHDTRDPKIKGQFELEFWTHLYIHLCILDIVIHILQRTLGTGGCNCCSCYNDQTLVTFVIEVY